MRNKEEGEMKKLIILLCVVFLTESGYASVKKVTIAEVKKSVDVVEKAVKEGNENLVGIYTEALEIEKRATTEYLADVIKKKICKSAKIASDDFDKIRKGYSVFDISIGWAISQTAGIPFEKVIKEKEDKSWEEIIDKYFSGCDYNKREKIASKIKELNPPK